MKPLNRKRTESSFLQVGENLQLVADLVDSRQAGDASEDVVSDLLQRLAQRVPGTTPLPAALLLDLELEIRRDWGGEKTYISKSGESKVWRSRRDERIRAEHGRGDHVELLSRRWCLSIKRIRQIVAI